MLNLPIVKFEKSCNYLNEQLTLQNNNKQLLLDIISNIGLILNDSEEKFEQYDNILEIANEFLKSISTNITAIEQLNLEIKNITAELTGLLSEQNKSSKTKEFYIAAFSNIKHNIIVYSKKFQDMENTLTIDNNKFNEFINENNFKYNFVSIDDSTNSYTFTGFSINDTEEITADVENVEDSTNNDEIIEENSIETTTPVPENINKIDELTNEFKSLLLNISETNINDATSSVVSLFKELLPKEPATTFEDFLDLGNKSKEVENEDENEEEIIEVENNEIIFDEFDPIKMVEDFIIKDLESIIYEEHSGLIYEFDEEVNSFISYHENVVEEIDVTEDVTDNTSESSVTDSTNIEVTPELDIENILEDSDEIVDSLIENLDLLSETSLLTENLLSSTDIENELELLDLDSELLFENEEECFTEDLADVDEEIENTQDIEILIDNLETIENVEKSIFEELNTETSEDIVEESLTIKTDASTALNTDLFAEEIIADSNDSIETAETFEELDNSSENSLDFDEISLNGFDLLNGIDLLDNFDNSILENDIFNDIPSISETDELVETILTEDNEDIINEEAMTENDIIDEEIITENNIIDEEIITANDIIDEEIITENNIIDEEIIAEDSNQIEKTQDIDDFFKHDTTHDVSFKNKGISKKEFDEKLLKIENAIEDNKTLIISERTQKIYLPYKVSELKNYVESYPDSYASLKDVVNQEFILPFNYFKKHPSKSRFTEAYNLLKNREGRNFMKSVSYAFRLLNKNNLNPAIIASCKTQHELDSYLYYLDSDNLNNFKFFDIIYEVNPM